MLGSHSNLRPANVLVLYAGDTAPSGLNSSKSNLSELKYIPVDSAPVPVKGLARIRRLAAHQVSAGPQQPDDIAASRPPLQGSAFEGRNGDVEIRPGSQVKGGRLSGPPGLLKPSSAASESQVPVNGTALAQRLVPMDILPVADPTELADSNKSVPPSPSPPSPPPPLSSPDPGLLIDSGTEATMRRPGGGH